MLPQNIKIAGLVSAVGPTTMQARLFAYPGFKLSAVQHGSWKQPGIHVIHIHGTACLESAQLLSIIVWEVEPYVQQLHARL